MVARGSASCHIASPGWRLRGSGSGWMLCYSVAWISSPGALADLKVWGEARTGPERLAVVSVTQSVQVCIWSWFFNFLKIIITFKHAEDFFLLISIMCVAAAWLLPCKGADGSKEMALWWQEGTDGAQYWVRILGGPLLWYYCYY